MSRRLTGDFTGMLRMPLSNVAGDVEAAKDPQKPSASTTFRVKSISNAKKFPFSKAQLTISLESEKVRSSEVCDGIDGLIGQELVFDTDPYLSRSPVLRIKEKELTMSPDFGRSAKVAEGTAEISTDGQFPKTINVDLSMRHKTVGVMVLEVLYKNLDLDKIIDDANKGRVNGFKNFQLDADFDVVQAAAIEWVNCMQPAIDVINYTLMKIDIGFCCTVWYRIRRENIIKLKAMQSLQPPASTTATTSVSASASAVPTSPAALDARSESKGSLTSSPRSVPAIVAPVSPSSSPELVPPTDAAASPDKARSPHSPRKKDGKSRDKSVSGGATSSPSPKLQKSVDVES